MKFDLNRRTLLVASAGAVLATWLPSGPALASGGLLRMASSADAQPQNVLAGRAGN